jgi:integrase
VPVVAENPKPKQLYDADDVFAKIVDDSKPLQARAIVAFLMTLCCRPNEMFPLEWSDIDWKHEQVRICKALRKDKHTFKVVPFTKTGRKGDRVLPLGPLLSEILRRLQKERMNCDAPSPYVFCWTDGSMLDTYRFKLLWHRSREALGLSKGPSAYSLKTLGVSIKSANGVPDAVLAKLCRHTTTRMVQNTYRSVYDAELLRAVEVTAGNGLGRSVCMEKTVENSVLQSTGTG